MPIVKKKDGWYYGKQGPFKSKKKAEEVAAAINARKGAIDEARKMPPWMGKGKK